MASIRVARAGLSDLDALAPLFDAYRVFYGQSKDLIAAKAFVNDRLSKEDGVIFMAWSGSTAVGFTQLYPTYSSVSMQAFYILIDLFVHPDHRKKGIGALLLEAAQAFASQNGMKGLALETANDNPAQKLYERLGWKKDTEFLHYFWTAPKT